MERYDVIIAGASFGGLAVATQIKGRVLLIDPYPIGENQVSACATLFEVPECLGLMKSVLQIHHEIELHTPSLTRIIDVSSNPFCTFDYRRFCQGMAESTSARFLLSRVLACKGDRVITTQSEFAGEILVDATGWRRVLGDSLQPCKDHKKLLSFGIETVIPRQGEKLCFWFNPGTISTELAWFFPAGTDSRVGVGTYTQKGRLGGALEGFLEGLGVSQAKERHGGYFPSAMGWPVQDYLFLVGDAAGQCLPMTGEGIRPAIYFGLILGAIIQQILDGVMSLSEGLLSYRKIVLSHRKLYRYLRFFQYLLVSLPRRTAGRFLVKLCQEPFLSRWLKAYIGFTDFKQVPGLYSRSNSDSG